MARNGDLVIPKATWTQITNDDVSEITFQNKSKGDVLYIQGTADSTSPVAVEGIEYGPMQGEYALTMSEAFPGVDGVARVWAYIEDGGEVFVSHA